MSTNDNDGTLLGKLITWILMALLAVAALKLAFWLLRMVAGLMGAAFGIGSFLLFTLGPIVLVGWLVLKLLRWLSRPKRPYDDFG